MDIRDIKEEPVNILNGEYLQEIYREQKILIDHYVSIEGLPKYPINVNTKQSQTLLKDFTGRVIEELAEGYESFLQVKEMTEKNHGWMLEYKEADYIQCLNHLQNANEEQADALHFMVELLIFANIQPEDIQAYVVMTTKEFTGKTNLEGFPFSNDIIRNCQILGAAILAEDPLQTFRNFERVDILGNTEAETDMFYQGGRYYNVFGYHNFKQMLWDITYHLNISRNYLKNKPWKQSEMMTNEGEYQGSLAKAFVIMMGYFHYLGLTSKEIYFLYFKKNMVNQFRIKSNY